MKTCNKCEIEKPLTEFYKAGNYKGKPFYSSSCKICTRSRVKEYRKENPEKAKESKQKAMEKKKEYYEEFKRKYYAENKADILRKQKEYYQENREKILEYTKEYNKVNKDDISRKNKVYYRENIESFRYHRRVRKARERNSGVDLSKDDYQSILKHFDNKCAITGSKDIHMDHFIPVASGYGETSIRNLIPLDKQLNLSKGPKNPFEWAKEIDIYGAEKFVKLISYLAGKNGFDIEEYEAHVYNCCEKI